LCVKIYIYIYKKKKINSYYGVEFSSEISNLKNLEYL